MRATTSRARKRFGQHFLEPAWADKVIRAIDPKPDDVFIEIGPGRGALTRPLAALARSVTAFEIDRDLSADLRERAPANVTIVTADFLDLEADLRVHPGADTSLGPYKIRVAGNLPYNVASPILFKLRESYGAGVPLSDATLMLQREVADRLVAQSSTKEYGVLSVLIRHSARVARLLNLPPGAFRPAPKVHSSVVRLRFHAPEPPVLDSRLFTTLVQAVFTRRRKMIANALEAFAEGASVPPERALDDAGIDRSRRPETLTIAEFARLADVYRRRSGEGGG
jgi:16S rRNA (adenine1518-N6/adenine1519-N6)-dimethyltransferase